MIDFHTHILPNMDDGPKSVETSLELLNLLEKQDVKLVCLTSHFYANKESIDEFITRRNEAFKLLDYKGNLELRLGAEVHYYPGISENKDIEKLCLQDSNILLLELPFETSINEIMMKEMIVLLKKGIRVMLAHIERYDIDEKTIRDLKNNGVLIQANCEFILQTFFNKGLSWLKGGYIDVLGTDCHDLDKRKPNYLLAANKIKKKLGENVFNIFMENSDKILML